jgi:hypothetical protein
MTTVTAHKLVAEMYVYFISLESREAKDGVHIVYEDEYDVLKKLHDDASEAVTQIAGPYTRTLKSEIDSLCDSLDDVEFFLDKLNNSRKTD